MENLINLYKIHSPSRFEEDMSMYVQKTLETIGVEFLVDTLGQVYNIIPGTPLISCHMDQVGKEPLTEIYWDDKTISADKNLGADDKNGIWICIELLKRYNGKLSFVFSTEEEIGGNVDILLDQVDISECLYGLIFDRKGSGDIIGTKNYYCVKKFEDDLAEIGESFGYSPDRGIYSDADTIRNYISCANLSVGYYKAHSDKEFTVISELKNSFDYACSIIEALTEKYEKPSPPVFDYKKWKKDNKKSGGYICGTLDGTGWWDELQNEIPSEFDDDFSFVGDDDEAPLCPKCLNSLENHQGYLWCPECGYSY